MSKIQNLSDLRTPPVIGQFYMVPTIDYIWIGRRRIWPVIGPMHHDKGPINFDELHYHIDGRFLNKHDLNFANKSSGLTSVSEINDRPISKLRWSKHDDPPFPLTPTLKKKRCTNLNYAWRVPSIMTEKWLLPETYGAPAPAIHLRDGRILCPHRKANLASFAPDENGYVKCPIHGLMVDCRKSAT